MKLVTIETGAARVLLQALEERLAPSYVKKAQIIRVAAFYETEAGGSCFSAEVAEEASGTRTIGS